MKKILMVSCEGLGNGGVQHVMMNITRNLSNKFHFDMLLFTKDVRYFETEFLKYGTIFRIPKYEGSSSFRKKIDYYIRFFRIYKGVKKILQNNEHYDVIHCNNYFEAAPCLMAAKHCNVAIRISHSHSNKPRPKILMMFYNFIYRKIINHYATTKIGCSQIAADFLFGRNKGLSVPNAIDLKKFDISKYSEQKIKHSFIHIGRFCNEKNQLFLLDVFEEIQKRWADATLNLIGNGSEEYKKLLQLKIKKLQINNVQFFPNNSNIPDLMAQSEYMVFPSLFEGFGLVLAEAQAMNVKCFASDVIPRETDIGLCEYISLNESAQYWAEEILKSENKPINKPDIYKVDLSSYLDKIKNLYEGKI